MSASVRLVFLGGLGEIGRNCLAIESDGRILIVDCGVMFPDPDMPGVDLVLPDFSYLADNASGIEGVVLTHGHEDHVGGLAFLLRDLPRLSIFGSAFTLGLARGRIEEAGLLGRADFVPVVDGERRRIGPFECQFIPVTHSVPHGFAIAIKTPAGTIVHSGDFKLDLSPVDGRHTDLAALGELGRQGVRLLLADSTNAEEPGHTPSESSLGPVFRELFRAHAGRRVVAACFASHLHRVAQITEAALAAGRTIAFLGRSMGQNIALARSMGLLELPAGRVVDISEIGRFPPGEVCVVCTGSQGEPLSALALMAAHENAWVKIDTNDVVIIAAHPIPGNEANVSRVIDRLYRAGAEVVHSGLAPVHVSGHACQEELKLLLSVVKPEHFVPVHGEYRHLVHHARLARATGIAAESAIICEDGDSLVLTPEGVTVERRFVPAGYVYVDGIVGDVGRGVLRDRRALAEEGIVVVVVIVDTHTGEVVSGPEIVTRGWVYAAEADSLLEEAAEAVRKSLAEAAIEGSADYETLRRHARKGLGRFINERTRRRPMIVPVVMEV
ncbi:MAG: ribonuclease J [Acidimicrobiia bacterium]